ncbi:MAG: hypothetical protein IEMM0008_1083 [bacterium]|nr:MAG: hypothetical protein IEMM0008_1083 [bacterium]
MAVKEYKLQINEFIHLRNRILYKSIPIVLLAISVGIFISLQSQSGTTSTLDILPFLIPIILLAMIFGITRGIKIQRDAWESYLLKLDDHSICKSQKNIPGLTIRKDEISEIVENVKGDIIIKTDQKARQIIIPKAIEHFDEVKEKIGSFKTIQSGKTTYSEIYKILISIMVLGVMAIFYVSKIPWVTIFTGVILILTLVWSFIKIRRNKTINKQTKIISIFVLFIIASIIVRLIQVFSS